MADMDEIDLLARWVATRRRLVVLTGAGCSTESGIPDYRDESGAWKRDPPMTLQQFMSGVDARRRYWGRSARGWQLMRDVQPGPAHRALALLEAGGSLDSIITQNVDRLHQRAGSRRVIDLHGRIDEVLCMRCRMRMGREVLQQMLEAANPGWTEQQASPGPDGDALIEADRCAEFVVLDCPDCRGTLKPAVVFFGETVPPATVAEAYRNVEGADGLLVVGSSLSVYSGYRFVRAALERNVAVAMVNLGRTRADAQVTLKIEAPCGRVLEEVAQRVLGSASRKPGETSITIEI